MPAQQVLRIFFSFSHRLRPPPNRIPSAVRSDSVRRPIRFRSPSDRIPSAVQSDSVRSTMTSAALFLDKHLQSLAQCYNFVRRNTNNNIINNLNEKHNYEYQVRNSRHQECQGRGKGTEVCAPLCAACGCVSVPSVSPRPPPRCSPQAGGRFQTAGSGTCRAARHRRCAVRCACAGGCGNSRSAGAPPRGW